MNTLVSIIIPCHNCAKFIAQAIESVIIQNDVEWELLIVDDGSNDSSKTIIQNFIKKDSRIQYLALNKKSGVAKARNTGIKNAKGRYIAFLDSDDYYLPNKLAKQIAFMQKKSLALSYTSYQLADKNDQSLGEFITKPNPTYAELLKTSCIGCSTVIYDTKISGKVYFPEMAIRADYVLWLSILKTTNAIGGILEPLSVYRIYKQSISNNKINAALYQWRVYRNFLKLGRWQSFYYFCHYAYYGFFKYR